MTDDPGLRRYGMRSGIAVEVLVPAATVLSAASLSVVLDVDAPWWLNAAVIAVLLLLSVWVAAAIRRAVTVVHEDHILIRTAFATRRVPWEDVQDIRIERVPGAAEHGLPARVVALYDRDGRRLWLPHLNEREVRPLEAELGFLRDLWVGRRGAGWAPVAEVTAKMNAVTAKTEGHAMTSGTVAALAGGCSAFFALGLFLAVGLTTDVLDGVPEDLMAYALFGTFPAVGLVVYVTSVLRRGRRRRL
ncbi:PH domain-containing protein OS=Streptomyces rochei OX=1928 GN=G3I25_11055 PE=4 SV=1 [Streptomyces rochei]|uniref:PH domain-containing protein n=1 Tax=Streptomyces sp. NRRL WC-3795 TaxID=1463938 RepID=UPI0004C9B225|nr:PH domain-containing protein [Streptomyces sp. NRRL WC-3795]